MGINTIDAKSTDPTPWYKSAQFMLTVLMLFSLMGMILVILWMPIPRDAGDTTTLKDILDTKVTVMTVLIGAFSAWIGAGASYYFATEQTKKFIRALKEVKEESE